MSPKKNLAKPASHALAYSAEAQPKIGRVQRVDFSVADHATTGRRLPDCVLGDMVLTLKVRRPPS